MASFNGPNENELKAFAQQQMASQSVTSKVYEPGIDETTATVGDIGWINGEQQVVKQQSYPQQVQEAVEYMSSEIDVPAPEELDTPDLSAITVEPGSYTGPGYVIDHEDLEPKEDFKRDNGIPAPSMDNINAYLENFDIEIEEAAAEKERIQEELSVSDDEEDDDTEYEDTDMTRDEFQRKYDEAVVIIDKTGMGRVIDFTDEDRAKLSRSKKIKLEEVENIKISTLKTKKPKKGNKLGDIIQSTIKMNTTPVVLPVSGYTCVMKGCSAHELISFVNGGESQMDSLLNKWSIIYSKIVSTSLGELTFNEFLTKTASLDYNILVYGILCSTYPDDDVIQLTCRADGCKKNFDHQYSIRSLMRVEQMSEKMMDLIADAVDNSYSLETSKECHENAPVNKVEQYILPSSGYVVELQVQTAYDLIYKSIKELADKDRDKTRDDAVILSTAIGRVLIEDPEDGEYFEFDAPKDICDIICSLDATDTSILTTLANKFLDGLDVKFGLMDIECPSCKHYTPSIDMDIESILFYRYQQAMSMVAE